jgi:hypothetical protein
VSPPMSSRSRCGRSPTRARTSSTRRPRPGSARVLDSGRVSARPLVHQRGPDRGASGWGTGLRVRGARRPGRGPRAEVGQPP